MKIIRNIEEIPFDKNSIVTIGTFDGLHLAHQKLISTTIEKAKELNSRSILITFEPHPRLVLSANKENIKILTTLEEKIAICKKTDLDILLVLSFDQKFSELSFSDFYSKYLIKKIGLNFVIEGYDHQWGKNREGNINLLNQIAKENNFSVICVEPFSYKGINVHSKSIREAIIKSDLKLASELLGRPYSLFGKIIVGDKRGRSLGYPTANLDVLNKNKLIPCNGIYFVKVILNQNKYFGITSIGVRPTYYENGKQTIETYILDFDNDIYGQEMEIEFLEKMRDELKFDSSEELIKQMNIDKEVSFKLISNYIKT